MAVQRIIPIEVDLSDQVILSAIQMVAHSNDRIQIICTNGGTSPVNFSGGYTAGVKIYTGRDYTSPQVVLRRPTSATVAPSTTGVSFASGGITGIINVDVQSGDLKPREPDVVTIEVWVTENTSSIRTLVTIIRVTVITNMTSS